jgi:hypothetical protein
VPLQGAPLSQPPTVAGPRLSKAETFTLGRYMKSMVWFYWMAVLFFAGIVVAGIRRQAVAGNLHPISSSNLNLVGLVVFVLSLLTLFLSCGYALYLLTKTTITSWGITRPTWPGGLAVAWSDVAVVTPARRGLRFQTKTGKILVIPFQMFDSVPENLLELLGECIPRPAFAGLDPDAPASWWSEKNG